MGDVRMTKVYEKQTKTVKRDVLVSRTCDWCGTRMDERYGHEREPYGERELTIRFLQGECFPDGDYMYGWKVEDLCDDCVAKLRTALEELGIKVQDAEREW